MKVYTHKIVNKYGNQIISSKILGAENNESVGTTWYKTSVAQAVNVIDNAWCKYILKELGWDALDLEDNLYGSFIDGNSLYIMDSDYQPVEVLGKEYEDPSLIADDIEKGRVDVDELDDYIEKATVDIIEKYITPYEFKEIDYNKYAEGLLQSGVKYLDSLDALNELDSL